MNRILERVKKEILHVLPVVIYFFLAITLFRFTFGLWLAHFGVPSTSFVRVLILSLVIGKIMLIVDHLPFLNIFRKKPLIYGILWKTLVYTFFSFLFRFVEHLIPLVRQCGSIQAGYQQLYAITLWPRFWTIQVWCFILFLVFVVSQQIVEYIGKERLRKLFFGV
ncbi:MAG: hypothetical protein PHW46_00820 [Candidatus Omnitrophica bacterium]|nr:hypothetical protein [Candidatus Omnitrophota bacterium]